jgi:hypothetical protein
MPVAGRFYWNDEGLEAITRATVTGSRKPKQLASHCAVATFCYALNDVLFGDDSDLGIVKAGLVHGSVSAAELYDWQKLIRADVFSYKQPKIPFASGVQADPPAIANLFTYNVLAWRGPQSFSNPETELALDLSGASVLQSDSDLPTRDR